MLDLYYRIWVDLIIRAKSRPESRENWQKGAMIFMSISMTLNFLLIMTILQKHVFGSYFYDIRLDFLPKKMSNVIKLIILFVLPCVAMNYFLIFYKHRCRKLLKRYPYRNGKLFLAYFLISMLLPPVLIIIGIITGEIELDFSPS